MLSDGCDSNTHKKKHNNCGVTVHVIIGEGKKIRAITEQKC
jgi:hypothetical protein